MWNRYYDIIMRTPIGIRHGTMTVIVDRCRVEGILNILQKANPFRGTIDEKGNCRIEGKITTLMRTIAFNATGRIANDTLSLELKGEQESFEISGTEASVCPAEEKEPTL